MPQNLRAFESFGDLRVKIEKNTQKYELSNLIPNPLNSALSATHGIPILALKKFVFGNGGAKESRTPDLLHAMQALYQLSYGPIGGLCDSGK